MVMAMSDAPVLPEEAAVPLLPKPVRLLDSLRFHVRALHYSRRTEKAYVQSIKRYIFLHGKRHPTEMGAAEGR